MTPRTLFTVILKIFGLYFIRDIFLSIPQFLSVILFFKIGSTIDAVWALISNSLILAIRVYVSYYLIFKTGWIVDKLKLTDGFEQETIPLNMHRSTMARIALIIIAGLILLDEIPNLARLAYTAVQESRIGYNTDRTKTPFIVASIVKIILAALILAEQRKIVSLILRKTNPEEGDIIKTGD